VDFIFNGTASGSSLDGLKVSGVKNKAYAESDLLPLWALESPGPGWNVTEISLLWGLAPPDDTGSGSGQTKFDIFRQESFPLPASAEYGLSGSGFGDSMVGISVSICFSSSSLPHGR
jgi:hypothetical protein